MTLKLIIGAAALGFVVAGCQSSLEPAEMAVEPVAASELRFMYGEWVGRASGVGPDRQPYDNVQTERVGPMLAGGVTVIEGRGYTDAGDLTFSAFAIISKNNRTGDYEIRSYTGEHSGTFPFELTDKGYVWSLPAGPNARMVFTASYEGDTWHQIGMYTPEDGAAHQTFEMTLMRKGDTGWPSAGYVRPPEN